ncbi:MAG: hypothetical protein GY745_12475 [Actinomycetia bacterium]|nr:hypothetical protein [Actinomycetes bacterium]
MRTLHPDPSRTNPVAAVEGNPESFGGLNGVEHRGRATQVDRKGDPEMSVGGCVV